MKSRSTINFYLMTLKRVTAFIGLVSFILMMVYIKLGYESQCAPASEGEGFTLAAFLLIVWIVSSFLLCILNLRKESSNKES